MRDQAARLEKSLGNVQSEVLRRVGGRERIRKTAIVVESASNNLLQSSQNRDEIESNTNLHMAEQKADNPLGIINTLPEGERGLFEASDQLYGTINICTGDFTP